MTQPVSRLFCAFAVVTSVVAIVSACGGQVNGNPVPSGSPSPTPTIDNPFAGVNPCQLLDKVLGPEDYSKAVPNEFGGATTCDTGKDHYASVTLTLDPGQKYTENINNPSTATSGQINGRPAMLEPEPVGSHGQCAIALQVNPDSRALLVLGLSQGTTDDACEAVNSVVTRLEPLLPRTVD